MTLSGGEQQMVVLAQALISRPGYRLLDELPVGLAPVVVSRINGPPQHDQEPRPGRRDRHAQLPAAHLLRDRDGLGPFGPAAHRNQVIEGATSITVTDVGNHHTYAATVVGYDQSQDIAMLRLATASGLRTVSLTVSSAVKTGETVARHRQCGGPGRNASGRDRRGHCPGPVHRRHR